MGLGGEIRSAGQVEARINEAKALGFDRAIIPKTKVIPKVDGIKLESVETISQALEILID